MFVHSALTAGQYLMDNMITAALLSPALLQAGEVVKVNRMDVGEGWWEGEVDGRRGLIPSSFVKLVRHV